MGCSSCGQKYAALNRPAGQRSVAKGTVVTPGVVRRQWKYVPRTPVVPTEKTVTAPAVAVPTEAEKKES